MANTIALLNDSFPPLIDGVANAVVNYADVLNKQKENPVVITPDYPNADDTAFPYHVLRYKSVSLLKNYDYRAGIPFSPEIVKQLAANPPALLHAHCPIVSTLMARQLRQIYDVPLVLTYHTKFDMDIANEVKQKFLQAACKKALAENIHACDEVWAVSDGAGKNMQALGCEKDYIVMPNGVDMPRGKLSTSEVHAFTRSFDLPENTPVYLFVGRMMWYKGIRIIMDALARLHHLGQPFRMIFAGDGSDREEMERYADSCGIGSKCLFLGAVRDRNALRAWYSKADLLLFPSVYDTNGLVVREAAAHDLPAILIKGSCAAEGVTDGRNGFLIEESADCLLQRLVQLYIEPVYLKKVGYNAGAELYLSWADAIHAAQNRYEIVMDRYRSRLYGKHRTPVDGIVKVNGDFMAALGKLAQIKEEHSSR